MDSLESLAKDWLNKVNSLSQDDKMPAHKRYMGAHWQTALSCGQQEGVELWVMSAGLGLIYSQQLIPDYQATFSLHSPDTIPNMGQRRADAYQQWWHLLCQESRFGFFDLFSTHPDDNFIIAGSNDYISAINDDVLNAIHVLPNPTRQLVIITSGTRQYRDLDTYILRSKATMAKALEANMLTLNINLAKRVLQWREQSGSIPVEKIKQELLRTIEGTTENHQENRIRRTPEYVEQYLKEALAQNPTLKPTPALRHFRDSGNSFEEKRFKAIFTKVAAARN
ncbi:hypothetical protein [Ferrimonas senticii]|uniref:hypothetical protein n=1 Tax=Ferrimonas senticii TaxID=394566 RepID=UPI0012EB75FC|nr:hypothetical protein [Ferrimonas senticii]